MTREEDKKAKDKLYNVDFDYDGDALIDKIFDDFEEEKSANPWHTGTPTEGGMYIVVTDIGYDVWEFNEDFKAWNLYFDNVKAWQKIEPYKEASK